MQVLSAMLVFCFISCNSLTRHQVSYWEKQKDNFRYQNKSEFVSHSTLQADYKTFKTSRHSLFGNFFSNKFFSSKVFLYSWQDRDSSKNEFTIIKDDGEGLKVIYFILDKKDSLLSSTQIAGKGNEGGYWFETRSRFMSKDTILNIGAVTQWYDFGAERSMAKTKGDSIFSYLVIGDRGKVTEKVFKEVKDLNFKNE